MTDGATGATIAVFRCSICRQEVGYEELYPPGVPRSLERGEEHPMRILDRYWRYSSNGDRFGDSELTEEAFARSVAALAGEHPASSLALYCPGCERVYCYRHWRVEYSGDPEMTMGICRKGHARVLDW
jgi:hypothetical protein